MQSPTLADSDPKPVATAQPLDTWTDLQSAQSKPGVEEKRNNSATTAEAERETPSQENKAIFTVAERTVASVAVTQAVDNGREPLDTEKDSASEPSFLTEPDIDTNLGPDVQKVKKQDVHDGRKYVPSKKAMIDPLKMDMSLETQIASSQLSLQCKKCHIIFCDLKSKERHLKLSHPVEYAQCMLRNALFICYVCDRHFTNSTELMIHQKAHIEKKPFKCPLCNQAFNKSSELTRHKNIHLGQDGYACTECGKPCKTLTLLKYHCRTHTGERPYVCMECEKRFTMSKALQKHIVTHLPEGADDGASTVKYSCSVCKATFKSTKTRLHHMKTKHNVWPSATGNTLPAGQQVKLSMPIITPISICQPALLQLEPNGPLQKVDANIDTEQIRKLIESLGNVQKVNQVVILGQVPPHAPPLEVQQITQMAEPVNLNLSPPKIDYMGLQHSKSKEGEMESLRNPCDSMEQTIILEPITPDGQLENSYFSELDSHLTVGETVEITLTQSEQSQKPEGEVMHQILQPPELSIIQSDPVNEIICQTEATGLKQDLEQTVILELTPALIPTLELEQSQTALQNEIPSSSLVPTPELERTAGQNPDQTVIDEQEAILPVPPLMATVQLELTPLQTEQQEPSSCHFVPQDTLTPSEVKCQSESEINPKEDVNSEMQTVGLVQVQSAMDGATPKEIQERTEQEQEPLENSEEAQVQMESLSERDNASAKEHIPSQADNKQTPKISELPVNIMSAQELVKVRKRKPARAFLFQGYMQELVGSLYKDDLEIDSKPAKRQRTRKSHLVVKFGSQSKEKKNKKQKKPIQKEKIQANLSEKKVALRKKGRKVKIDKKAGQLVSTSNIKSTSLNKVPEVQQLKEDTRKNKVKKQREETRDNMAHISEHKSVGSPIFKKKKQKAKILQKNQPTAATAGKKKKNLSKREKSNTKTGAASTDIFGPHIMQESLLLLKGHKQPQLKVYKLDPSKASSQTQETSPYESQNVFQQGKGQHPTSESTNSLTAEGKKKGGRPKKNQKAHSLLSSLEVSHQQPETLPTKPKMARKRKSSLNVETEGVITSSKRVLACKDCGERFSEVSSLQKHKAVVHIVESPGLTFTNGNIFEGVSRLDLYHLPKQHDKVVGFINTATGWDTEPEVGEMALEDKEQTVSFPSLIPSPSLSVPPNVDMSTNEDNSGSKTVACNNGQSHTSSEAHSLSKTFKNNEVSGNFRSKCALSISTQIKSVETRELLASDEDKQEEGTSKHLGSEPEVQAAMEEDIKEDLLLEVDVVTVGEQNERDQLTPQESVPQNESRKTCNSESLFTETLIAPIQGEETTDKSLTSQTASCSTHQVEIKEEEEEMLVQRKKEGDGGAVTRNAIRGKRRGTCPKRGVILKQVSDKDTVRGTELEKEQDECQVVYEKHPVNSDSEIHAGSETSTKASQPETSPDFEAGKSDAPAKCLPSMLSTLEESVEEQVVFELESVSTSVEDVMNERGQQGGEGHDRDSDQSPCIILEKFLTSQQRAAADEEACLMTSRTNGRQGLDSTAAKNIQAPLSQEIKVEESTTEPPQVELLCQNRPGASVQPQHHRDIRSVLVKEETHLMLNNSQALHGSRHIRWNVEPLDSENTNTSLTDNGEKTGDCFITPEFNTNQCIFYPVKEEEREVLLGTGQTNRGSLTPEGSSDAHQTEHQTVDGAFYEQSHVVQVSQETRVRRLVSEQGGNDFADVQAGPEAEQFHQADLRDFLLQSSDEEDLGGFELSDPHVDSEAEVMASYYKNQTMQQPDQNLPTSTTHLQATSDKNRTREPIDYFSKYFGWDTWVEIVNCTNKLSNRTNDVTAKEVAQFVGIHIAMGTLKFPSLRLYWEDLTKVPLIAEAMPLSRFLKLSRMLKLGSTAEDPDGSSVREGRRDSDFHNVQQGKTVPNRPGSSPQHSDGDIPNDLNKRMDPLWKVQPLLCRFKAGCQSLKTEDDYAVDQYPLPLTGKMHRSNPSLYCTTLIGFGGLLLHVDLKLDCSDKEDAVEKMAPKGSMVFLCKQELSTPAMLERLLIAGVHGAGRVGGAEGQIGDEFVSSDGKLMLRRSHCGFILSTAGSGQRNMASLLDNFEKAQMLARLHRDLLNLYSIPLSASSPTCWPRAVLWYLTDLALVNSWLLYRQDHRAVTAPLTLMAFRLEVSKALILSSSSDTQDSVPPPPTETAHTTNETPGPSLVEESPLPDAATRYDGSGHWPEQLREGEGGRCRFRDCQRTSRVLCLKCCVFLCISRDHNCFLNFHNQESLGKQ